MCILATAAFCAFVGLTPAGRTYSPPCTNAFTGLPTGPGTLPPFLKGRSAPKAPPATRPIFFPASWCYPHMGKMPISSDKYIITGWLHIK